MYLSIVARAPRLSAEAPDGSVNENTKLHSIMLQVVIDEWGLQRQLWVRGWGFRQWKVRNTALGFRLFQMNVRGLV